MTWLVSHPDGTNAHPVTHAFATEAQAEEAARRLVTAGGVAVVWEADEPPITPGPCLRCDGLPGKARVTRWHALWRAAGGRVDPSATDEQGSRNGSFQEGDA